MTYEEALHEEELAAWRIAGAATLISADHRKGHAPHPFTLDRLAELVDALDAATAARKALRTERAA